MNIRNHFSLVFVLFCCVRTHTYAQFRIKNGQDIPIESSPHSVAIIDNNNYYYCVGSIVNFQSVLTAAHCVKDENKRNLVVVAGLSDLCEMYKGRGQKRNVVDIHINRNYNPETKYMDIAIFKMDTPFDLNPAVQIIPLCDVPLEPGSDMEISGWGALDLNSETTSPLLKSKIVKIADGQKCRDPKTNIPLPKYYAKTIMYSGRSGENICFGDSGAGGVVNGRLCAVAQGSFEEPGYPDLYTNITNKSVRKFIKKWM